MRTTRPIWPGQSRQGWGVLELAARDHSRGMAGVFQLAAPRERVYQLRLRRSSPRNRYRVTWDNSSQSAIDDGFTLMNQGLTIELGGALTSELLLFEAVE